MANEESTVTNTDEVVENQQEDAGVPQSISLNDLQVLGQIVDLASQRGAFRGAELTSVGAIYDKLTAFLAFVAEQQAEQADNAGDEAPAEGE